MNEIKNNDKKNKKISILIIILLILSLINGGLYFGNQLKLDIYNQVKNSTCHMTNITEQKNKDCIKYESKIRKLKKYTQKSEEIHKLFSLTFLIATIITIIIAQKTAIGLSAVTIITNITVYLNIIL